MKLNDEQLAAIEYLEGPLLVLAGPGTGKTQLLSAKVAYILEKTDTSPSNILCLTFTEAGAENMRDRLKTMIGNAADDVTISTYHAFGRNILERYQNYAERPERELNTSIDETMQYRIVLDILKKLPSMDILKKTDPKDIIATIAHAKAARLTPNDLIKIAKQNVEDSNAIAAEIIEPLSALIPRMRYAAAREQVYLPIAEILAKYTSEQPITGTIERSANVMLRSLSKAFEECEAMEKPGVKKLSDWKNTHIERTSDGKYRLKDHIANKKLQSLANIMAEYEAILESKSLFDFNDMIEQSIKYLKEDDGFRLSQSEIFQYILLDEFQDTNTSQFDIIKLLTDYENPIIMAVGDDDQAIYAFQGANASNLLEFQNHYHAKVISLLKNYRSYSEILNLSRQIATQIDDSFEHTYTDSVTKELTAAKGAANTAAEICRHEFPCPEAEYSWLAGEIRRLIESGMNPSDIAILAPKHKYLAPILAYLKHQNIEISYEKRDNLLENEQIIQIIHLAKFIHGLASGHDVSSYLPEILSYDFWQIPRAEVINLFSERYARKKPLEYLATETFQPIANFFADLTSKSTTAPLELWLDYLIGTLELNGYTSPFLGYYKKHLSENELLEFYESLATFRQAALNHIHSIRGEVVTAPKLSDLIEAIDDFLAAGTAIMRVSNYRDAVDAVQVMTAHKSKGLEFKQVFLIAFDDYAWGKAKGNKDMMVLPKNLLVIRHSGGTKDEQLRLLFVAITRAKDTLILTSSRAASDGKSLQRLGYMNESGPEDQNPISPFLPEASQKILYHGDELSLADRIQTMQLSWLAKYQTYTPDLEPLMQSRVENYRITASDLTGFIDLAYAGPQAIYERLIMHAPPAPATREQLYGTLVHQVFESVTKDQIDNEAAINKFRAEVPKTDLDEDEQKQLLESGEHNLSIALSSFGEILRRPGARAEVNLSSEHLHYGGVPLTGKIDHIEINEDDKTIEIYDYKTGKYHDKKWESLPQLYKYRLQLDFYRLLLNLSPTYQKYRVTRGHILFVTPDLDQCVYDKVHEYSDASDQELKNLVKAVYHQITSLGFIRDPEVFVPADPSCSMAKIRSFVNSLLEKYKNSAT